MPCLPPAPSCTHFEQCLEVTPVPSLLHDVCVVRVLIQAQQRNNTAAASAAQAQVVGL